MGKDVDIKLTALIGYVVIRRSPHEQADPEEVRGVLTVHPMFDTSPDGPSVGSTLNMDFTLYEGDEIVDIIPAAQTEQFRGRSPTVK